MSDGLTDRRSDWDEAEYEAAKRDPHKYGQTKYEYSDEYYTPPWCVEALMRHLHPEGYIIDPCVCDDPDSWGVRNKLRALGHEAYALKCNVLEMKKTDAGMVVTNPPYSIAENVVRHILKWDRASCFLLRNEWDCAGSRKDLMDNLSMKVVLTKRPRWIGGSTGSPRHNFAWYVFNYRRGIPCGGTRIIYE